jgi:CelD/BcsL family acetyltransferase involved in cellulose biosynthesis
LRYLDRLSSIRDEWVEVHRKSAEQSPFLSFEFLDLWYRCFAEPDGLRIYRVRENGRTIGFLPLVLRHERGIRVLESLTNDHCFHGDPLVCRGYEEAFPGLLLKELIRDTGGWDLLRHRFSYSFSALPGLFPDDLLARCGLPWNKRSQRTYSIRIRRPFDEYYRGDLKSGSRKTIRKHRNRLARLGEVQYRHLEGVEALRRWPEFLRIEGSGWKGRAGSSIDRTSADFQRYYEGLVELLARSGALRIFFLEVDGEGVAGELGYFVGETFHAFKTGYDERIHRCSPGNLLLMHILEHLSREHPETVRLHLFPWDHEYKHRFVNETAHCIETRLFNLTLQGRAAHLLLRVKEGVKRVVKKQPAEIPDRQIHSTGSDSHLRGTCTPRVGPPGLP